jgi:hypothetical protein
LEENKVLDGIRILGIIVDVSVNLSSIQDKPIFCGEILNSRCPKIARKKKKTRNRLVSTSRSYPQRINVY